MGVIQIPSSYLLPGINLPASKARTMTTDVIIWRTHTHTSLRFRRISNRCIEKYVSCKLSGKMNFVSIEKKRKKTAKFRSSVPRFRHFHFGFPTSVMAHAEENAFGDCDFPGGCKEHCHAFEAHATNSGYCWCEHRRAQHKRTGM